MDDRALILEWLSWMEHNRGRQPGTVNKYLRYLELLSVHLARENKSLLTAERDDIEAFTGIEAHRRGMAPRSRRPVVVAVRGFYAWALRSGLVGTDPSGSVPYPKAGRRLPRGMDLKNAERILMAPDLESFLGVRDAAILSVFIGCGLRLTGVSNLNQSDLVFVDDVDGKGERLVIRLREKGDNERFVPAPHETRLLVRAYLGHEELERIDRTLPDGDQVLFVSTMDRTVPPHEYYGERRRISTRSIAEMVEKYGEQVGIPRDQCHPHALRHLYGTELGEEDVHILKMQALLGHSNPNTTKDYVRVAMRSLAKEVDRANPLGKIKTPVSELARVLRAG